MLASHTPKFKLSKLTTHTVLTPYQYSLGLESITFSINIVILFGP